MNILLFVIVELVIVIIHELFLLSKGFETELVTKRKASKLVPHDRRSLVSWMQSHYETTGQAYCTGIENVAFASDAIDVLLQDKFEVFELYEGDAHDALDRYSLDRNRSW